MSVETRVCSVCRAVLPLDRAHFHVRHDGRGGFAAACKACEKARRQFGGRAARQAPAKSAVKTAAPARVVAPPVVEAAGARVARLEARLRALDAALGLARGKRRLYALVAARLTEDRARVAAELLGLR